MYNKVSFIHSFVRSVVPSFVLSFDRVVCSFVRSFVRSFARSFSFRSLQRDLKALPMIQLVKVLASFHRCKQNLKII